MTTRKNGHRTHDESMTLIAHLIGREDTTLETLMAALNRGDSTTREILKTAGLPIPPRAKVKAREDTRAIGYQPWRDDAACNGAYTEEFFPHEYTPTRVEAIRVTYCGRCPVRDACLGEALAWENGCAESTRAGIYAGTTPRERALMQRGAA